MAVIDGDLPAQLAELLSGGEPCGARLLFPGISGWMSGLTVPQSLIYVLNDIIDMLNAKMDAFALEKIYFLVRFHQLHSY